MSDSQGNDVHMVPPLADLSGKEAPVPGPLTKPVPVQRSRRTRRPRWMLLIVAVAVLAIIGGIIWWSLIP